MTSQSQTRRPAADITADMSGDISGDMTSDKIGDKIGDRGISVEGIRIGVVEDYYFDHVQPEVDRHVRAAIRAWQERGAIVKSGSWFSLGDVRVGQGRANALTWLKEHPKEQAELLAKAMADLSVTGTGAGALDEAA